MTTIVLSDPISRALTRLKHPQSLIELDRIARTLRSYPDTALATAPDLPRTLARHLSAITTEEIGLHDLLDDAGDDFLALVSYYAPTNGPLMGALKALSSDMSHPLSGKATEYLARTIHTDSDRARLTKTLLGLNWDQTTYEPQMLDAAQEALERLFPELSDALRAKVAIRLMSRPSAQATLVRWLENPLYVELYSKPELTSFIKEHMTPAMRTLVSVVFQTLPTSIRTRLALTHAPTR